MSTSYPPPSAPRPPQRNNAWLAVIAGILIVLVVIVGFGVFVISRFVHNTHIVTSGSGANQVTNIQSPLGNLHVQGDGKNARVSIQSPFGDIKVVPQPDLAQLDMTIYPGATEVLSPADSPFHDNSADFSEIDGIRGVHFDSPGAEVTLRGGGGAMLVNVAEFRAPASTAQVLHYYQQQLSRLGAVQQRWENGTQGLQLRRSKDDVRYVAVRTGSDGTHFVLVRVKAGDAAR
ncbi:MAG: hypothetical protein EPN33_12565 [Acidobacteria bacterium]|nr:MAG: hypothetical protein EPN33_12565 [Acidobacteriota bacterium]